ncbi:hypothetical protein BJ138DRAFT_1103737 [Hygrophoropsis aurantiaca]|uniref:Uncharacterized protein n=1 Tax=Hygrophoropsis aurantiaca TaxID=72124 RepID=A0ACB8A530_9AGAM|nr:hypothetical protein BJ138DRAFT_1103737 [Hygrophoropsis aurantiaca]
MADSASIQELQTTQTACYLTVSEGGVAEYDPIGFWLLKTMLPDSVDLIWNRQWSFITALYLIARYSGSLSLMGLAARAMCSNWTYSGLVNMYLAVNWGENIFLLTMQAILTIRVYALFDKSKKVLIFLATFYVLQAIAVLVMVGLLMNNWTISGYIVAIGPTYGSVGRFLTLSNSVFFLPAQESAIPFVVFDTVLLFFALWASVGHSLEAKTSDGEWSISVLVRTLLVDHLVYFVCYVIWLSLSLATNYLDEGVSRLDIVIYTFNTLAVVTGPRMVISLRALDP